MLFDVGREARDVMRAEALGRLSEIDDVLVAVQNGDMLLARMLRGEYVPMVRLLDDLGWNEADERHLFELTMPATYLTDVVSAMHRAAVAELRRRLTGSPTDPDTPTANEGYLAVLHSCESLYAVLVFELRNASEPTEPERRRTGFAISRPDRDALHAAVCSDLPHLLALPDAIRERQFRTAQTLGARYDAELALLDGLGWEKDDERDRFELTIPNDQLARALLRLINHTVLDALVGDRPPREEEPSWDRRVALNKRTVEVCGELLQHLPPDVVASAGEPLPEGWAGR